MLPTEIKLLILDRDAETAYKRRTPEKVQIQGQDPKSAASAAEQGKNKESIRTTITEQEEVR